ncbi:MAG TPA: POTRA domain-containing protein [Bryobacteraceae bacterium]|jgi:outer membrane protein assembly factor BamA|nr:POTRA domain-containing protein [Bryobacteraceae bacterium]
MNSQKLLRLIAAFACATGGFSLRAQNPPPQPRAPIISGVIESIEFRGVRRIPQDTLRALLASKPGEMTSEETLRRDFTALWNTGRFDDIRMETVASERGGVIVRFTVTERAVAQAMVPAAPSIPFRGAGSALV